MRSLSLLAPAMAALILLSAGCVSRSAGFSRARDTVRERTKLEVPSDDDMAGVRKDILSRPLTAESAARLALASSPDVQAVLANIGVARAKVVGALRLPNPRADLGVHYHASSGALDLDVGVTIELVDLLLLPARGAVASELLDASALEAASMLLEVAYGARIAFFEYQGAAQILELRKTVTYAAAQSAAIAAKLLEAGNVPELEALNERALYEETRLALARAEVQEATARERLNAALGLFGEPGASWKTEGRIPDPDAFDAATLESRAIAANLDLSALEKRHGASASQSDLAWAEGFLPEIEAGIGFERENDETDWGYGPRVGVSVPLFYQGQGEVAAAEAQMLGAKSRHASTAIRVRATARALALQLSGARQSAEFYKTTLLPLREKIVDETLRQYNAMNLGPFQVLQAKRDQVEAARAHVEVLRDYWVTRTQVDMLLAGRAPAMPTGLTIPDQRSDSGARDQH